MDTAVSQEALSVTEASPSPLDLALQAISYAAGRFDITATPEQLKHRLGRTDDEIDPIDLCRCAGWLGLRARRIHSSMARLTTLPLPALLKTDQGWLVLTAVKDDQVTLFHPQHNRCQRYNPSVLAAQWQGEVILLAEQANPSKRQAFGFSWFIPSIKKHIRQFRSVILVSLVLQLIPLVTPMLFENIIDRVLVSRSLSSLQVLGIALLALALFEPIYGFIRSWLFANLASKVNSELSSRLYQHLVALPMNYFQQRQSGEVIARVREMGEIRQFLTGSALTMLLDLVFVGLFLAVMFAYAPKLTWLVLGSLVLYFLFWLVVGPILRSRVTREYELAADNTAFLAESVTGIETIKTSATEHRFLHKWEQHLVIDKGQIIEEGDHEQLIQQQGLYATLWQQQTT